MFIIASKRQGFRRCGIAHSKDPVEHPNDKFNEKELAVLVAEPMLSVQYEPDPVPEVDETPEPALTVEKLSDLVAAARKAIEDGNTIGSGAPSVDAIEDILGRSITADERDQAWTIITKENEA